MRAPKLDINVAMLLIATATIAFAIYDDWYHRPAFCRGKCCLFPNEK